ncbi:MAG: response regulator [Bacteriovoracaceae bacterium]|nr:response regulator [Bacteriovoracaceae bacterium]
MSAPTDTYYRGLEGVIAAESKICYVDGIKGELFYRGHEISGIINNPNLHYEEVALLLLCGGMAGKEKVDSFKAKLLKYRKFNNRISDIIKDFAVDTHPMKVMQACTAALGGIWDNKDGDDANEIFLAYISQFPLIIAAYWRYSNRQEIIAPNLKLSFSGNFLYMLLGKIPSQEHIEAFDNALILHMEHGFNASTFTGRVIASSMATVSSSLSGALGSLTGPLHGGANERVLEMVEKIGSVDNVKNFLDDLIDNGGKVMGMGHRVYRVKDPRAKLLQDIIKTLDVEDKRVKERLDILNEVDSYFSHKMELKNKQIYPNVDFYSGTLLSILGIDPLLFTPIFALARVVGWCAHIREQWQDNRIFRPKCRYVGAVNLKMGEQDVEYDQLKPSKKKVMIIDDDPDIVEAMQIPLEANGFKVTSSNTVANAVEFITEEEPDIVLLDVSFPENHTAGFDVCYEVREHQGIKHIPIVILSAIREKFGLPFTISGQTRTNRAIPVVPADRLLEKPLNPEALLTVIDELIG